MPLVDPVTMAGASSTAQTVKLSSPIDILPTPTARTVTHIHPVILLSAYYFLFPRLVADPVATLFMTLPALAITQVAYAACSLPAAKGSKGTKKPHKTKPGVAKKTAEGHSLPVVVSHPLQFLEPIAEKHRIFSSPLPPQLSPSLSSPPFKSSAALL